MDHLGHHDYFMVVADFEDYVMAQEQVERAFHATAFWARSAVFNTAWVAWFSSDRAIRTYDREICDSQEQPDP